MNADPSVAVSVVEAKYERAAAVSSLARDFASEMTTTVSEVTFEPTAGSTPMMAPSLAVSL